MITGACLLLTALLGLAAAALFAVSSRRRDGFLGLAALTTMITAAIPATVYGSLTS